MGVLLAEQVNQWELNVEPLNSPRDSKQSSADRDQRERGHRQHSEAAEAKKQFFYAGTYSGLQQASS